MLEQLLAPSNPIDSCGYRVISKNPISAITDLKV